MRNVELDEQRHCAAILDYDESEGEKVAFIVGRALLYSEGCWSALTRRLAMDASRDAVRLELVRDLDKREPSQRRSWRWEGLHKK